MFTESWSRDQVMQKPIRVSQYVDASSVNINSEVYPSKFDLFYEDIDRCKKKKGLKACL